MGILWEFPQKSCGNGNENSLPTATLQHISSQTQSFTTISFQLGNSETCDNKNIIYFASIGKTAFFFTIRIYHIIVLIIIILLLLLQILLLLLLQILFRIIFTLIASRSSTRGTFLQAVEHYPSTCHKPYLGAGHLKCLS